MENQLYLFDIRPFDINTTLFTLKKSIVEGWRPFSVDILQKAATLHHVSCGVILDTYERVTHEQFSDTSED